MANLKEIVAYLDGELRVADFDDVSHNGLQVESDAEIRRVCCGVDASMEFFTEAQKRGADLVVCHHGLSWGDSLKRITDLNYRRLAFLIRGNMALYACHLPLDAHSRYGNNILICKALKLRNVKPFGAYHGVEIGFCGTLPRPVRYVSFKKQIALITGNEVRSMDVGRKTVRSVAVVSGGAADQVMEAGQKGIDVYVSGEPNLSAYGLAQEYGVNAVFAGHYATEVFGVRALAEVLCREFKVDAEFIDLHIAF